MRDERDDVIATQKARIQELLDEVGATHAYYAAQMEELQRAKQAVEVALAEAQERRSGRQSGCDIGIHLFSVKGTTCFLCGYKTLNPEFDGAWLPEWFHA